MKHLRPLLAPQEVRGKAASSDFVPLFGDPRDRRGLCSTSALFWAPEKAGVRRLFLILAHLLGSPENAGAA